MGRQLSKFRFLIFTSEEQVFIFFLTPRMEMREQISPQTPSTREFTTRRALLFAGSLAVLTRQHRGSSPLQDHTPAPCPSPAQILVWISHINQTTACLDRRKNGGAAGPTSAPTCPEHLFLTFIFCQPLTQLIFNFTVTTPPPLHVPITFYTSYPLPTMPRPTHEMHTQWQKIKGELYSLSPTIRETRMPFLLRWKYRWFFSFIITTETCVHTGGTTGFSIFLRIPNHVFLQQNRI